MYATVQTGFNRNGQLEQGRIAPGRCRNAECRASGVPLNCRKTEFIVRPWIQVVTDTDNDHPVSTESRAEQRW